MADEEPTGERPKGIIELPDTSRDHFDGTSMGEMNFLFLA